VATPELPKAGAYSPFARALLNCSEQSAGSHGLERSQSRPDCPVTWPKGRKESRKPVHPVRRGSVLGLESLSFRTDHPARMTITGCWLQTTVSRSPGVSHPSSNHPQNPMCRDRKPIHVPESPGDPGPLRVEFDCDFQLVYHGADASNCEPSALKTATL